MSPYIAAVGVFKGGKQWKLNENTDLTFNDYRCSTFDAPRHYQSSTDEAITTNSAQIKI